MKSDATADQLAFVRYQRLDGVMVAVFNHSFDPIYCFPPELCYNLESLMDRVANLRAAGADAYVSEKALREWPSG